jgi:cation transport ATPase
MPAGFVQRSILALLTGIGLALDFAMPLLGQAIWQDRTWAAFAIPVLIVLVYDIAASLRRGEVGLDIAAKLSMVAAIVVGEELAAVVVALMYAGGQFLEAFAERHARREMTALLARVPRTAVRHRADGLEEVALDLIVPGDRLLVRQGDVIPTDGVVAGALAVLNQSALTEEPVPVQHHAGDARLVDGAQRSKAPMSRLADRFAMVFLAITVLIAAVAWFFTGETASGLNAICRGGQVLAQSRLSLGVSSRRGKNCNGQTKRFW